VKPDYITKGFLQSFIASALAEDIGDGDHSALAAIPKDRISRAQLLVKDQGILAGVELASKIFKFYDPTLRVEIKLSDGSEIRPKDVAFFVSGSARSILTTERLVLNCMQRMSAIATKAAKLRSIISGTNAKLLDTRKTTPNFRLLEKWAVHIGGGHNHRIGLYDMIMLKDNHIDMAGGLANAINQTKDYLRATNKTLKIEVETRNLKEVEEVLAIGGIDFIMLDNMDIPTMKEAVTMIGGRFETEASGGITEETIRAVAETGVDYISVGALTHTVASLDLSLKAVK
jgi:nicotinate-nucleotide pyrophosphorylase (carboxylating)